MTHDARPKPRVLVVEDNVDVREMLVEMLELEGFHVDSAADGSEALERALATKPDVAILDIGLPIVGGYEVARRVREELGSAIRLVALTGWDRPEDRERIAQAGFDAHLVKPVDPTLLPGILETVLARPSVARGG